MAAQFDVRLYIRLFFIKLSKMNDSLDLIIGGDGNHTSSCKVAVLNCVSTNIDGSVDWVYIHGPFIIRKFLSFGSIEESMKQDERHLLGKIFSHAGVSCTPFAWILYNTILIPIHRRIEAQLIWVWLETFCLLIQWFLQVDNVLITEIGVTQIYKWIRF